MAFFLFLEGGPSDHLRDRDQRPGYSVGAGRGDFGVASPDECDRKYTSEFVDRVRGGGGPRDVEEGRGEVPGRGGGRASKVVHICQ